MGYSHATRLAAAIVAGVAWTAETLFFVAQVRATGSVPYSAWLLVAYLTDWSNLLVALVCTAIALGVRRFADAYWQALAMTAIGLVGLMFAVMGGWAHVVKQGVSSGLAHVATPLLLLLLWSLVLPHGGLRWRDVPRLALFPALYLLAMFGRGLAGGGYPYPEVDVSRVGWTGALAFAAGITMVFVAISCVVVAVDRALVMRGNGTPGKRPAAQA